MDDDYTGKEIGSYQLIKRLGSGAFGSVYLASHRYLHRTTAVKILHPRYSHSQQELEAFFQEARILDSLKHRHILPVIDVGIHDDLVYMMSEYAPNNSLHARIQQCKPALLPMKDALLVISQVGQALQHAHEHNIVHRDLKPSNILFNERGEALLADFGIAVLLENGTAVYTGAAGTVPYMAPEQFEGKVSLKSDQYALACIAYELLTGHWPINGPASSDFAVWGHKHQSEDPIPPRNRNYDIASHVSSAILKALAKDRAQRHMNVALFITQMTTDVHFLDMAEMPTVIYPEELLAKSSPQLAKKSVAQWLSEGKSLYREKRFAEAIVAFEQAIQLGHKEAQIFYLLGNMLRELHRLDDALDAYEQAIQLDPRNDIFYNSKGNVLTEQKEYKRALDAYEQALKVAPHKAILHKNRADTLRSLEYYQEAIEAYEQVTRLEPYNAVLRVKVCIGKGETLLELRNREEALKVYEQAIVLDTDNPVLHTIRGDILWRLKRNEQALEAYQQAIKLRPDDPDLYRKLGSTLRTLGRTRDAQQAYEKAQLLSTQV